MLLQVVVTLVGLVTALYFYFTRTFNYWKNRNVVGPEPVVFFGNLKESTLRRTHMVLVFKSIYDQYPNEKIVGVYRMTSPTLLIRDPDLVKQVMIKDFDSFVDRGFDFGDKGLGVNLFHANSEKWRVLRNRFTPVFTSGKLRNMMYLITERGDHSIEHIKSECMNKPKALPVVSLVQKYTIASISACAFGLDIDTNSEEFKQLQEIDRLIFSLNYNTELDMMYPGLLKKFGMNLFPRSLDSFFLKLVRDIIRQRNGEPSDRKDFMDLILALRNQKTLQGNRKDKEDNVSTLDITDEIISAQAFVFYAAGYETSATTMGYMLYELAKRPDMQERVRTEILEVLEKYDGQLTYEGCPENFGNWKEKAFKLNKRQPSYEAIQELNYLTQVFDETLRMYPIADPLIRTAQYDYKVPGINLVLKKGQTIAVSVNGLHNDEQYYPNPSKFDPERFNAENSAKRHPSVYLPFGIGPRNCIGMRFAQVQSRICVVKILQNFRLQANKNTPKQISYDPHRLVPSARGGIELDFLPIN